MAGWHVHVHRIAAELRTEDVRILKLFQLGLDLGFSVVQLESPQNITQCSFSYSEPKLFCGLREPKSVVGILSCVAIRNKVWSGVERASIWIIWHTWTCSVTVSFICGQLMLISPRTKARFDWRYPFTLEMALRDHSKDTSLWATAFVTSDRHRSSWALSSRGLR